MFRKRFIQAELLDDLPPDEARPNLEDLVRINQRFGGHSVVRRALRRALGNRRSFTLLDIGAASGDTARLITGEYPGATVISLDRLVSHLEPAPHPKVAANAFDLPFADSSVDYVFCSLFLHHFSDSEVTELLRAFHRVARYGLVVCDLERHIAPFVFLPATRRVFGWNKITVHDGKISVRASFRADELRALAEHAGIRGVDVQVYRPAFRLAMVAAK